MVEVTGAKNPGRYEQESLKRLYAVSNIKGSTMQDNGMAGHNQLHRSLCYSYNQKVYPQTWLLYNKDCGLMMIMM